MTSTVIQTVSPEDVKQAIIALIKENNADFRQFIVDNLPNLALPAPKKTKKKQTLPNTSPQNGSDANTAKKERIPYSEMPFWKANPHLKPRIPEGKGTDIEAFLKAIESAQESFKDISDEEWDKMLKELD